MQCPYILPESEISKECNKRINYADFGGTEYIFYDHDDGFGNVTRVQFCQLIGRKRDVFECFNEVEWRACRGYRTQVALAEDEIPNQTTLDAMAATERGEVTEAGSVDEMFKKLGEEVHDEGK